MTQLVEHPAAVPAGPGGAVAREERRLLAGTAALCVTLFLFLGFSRMTDMLFPGPPILLGLSVLSLAIVVLNGSAITASLSRPGLCMFAYFGWACLASPFGIWPGGSFGVVREELLRSILAFVIVSASLRTLAHVRTALIATGLATFIAGQFAFYHDARVLGRLVLPVGSYANPNDIASALLLGAPLIWCLLSEKKQSPLWKRLLVWGATCSSLFAVSMTGSRGALVALAGMVVVVARMSRFTVKLLIVTGAFVGLLAAPLWLPESVKIRLGLSVEREELESRSLDRELSAAVGSADERMNLLRHSVILTIRNPLLGVGPGNFAPASADLSREFNEDPMWRKTHNAFTQVSSETGVPGLLFYLGAIASTIGFVRQARRRALAAGGHEDTVRAATALQVSITGLLVTSFFTSLAYFWLLPVLAGFGVALHAASTREIPEPVPGTSGARGAGSERALLRSVG